MATSAAKGVSQKDKESVKKREGGKCWLCGEKGKEVAHVIARSKKAQYVFYRDLGLFPTWSHVNSIGNLMYLCGGCHKNFDEKVPEWIFLPEDLGGFLETEKKFQEDRKANQQCCRTPPICMKRRYKRYQIYDRNSSARAIKRTKAKDWTGSPIAAIVQSLTFISSTRLDPDSQEGLPEDVAAMVQELLLLYGKHSGIDHPRSVEVSEEKAKTKQTLMVVEKTRAIGEPKAVGKNNKRPLPDDEDDDGGTCDNASVDTNQTAFSYDTRLSRAMRRKKIPRLAFVTEELASDTETERSSIPGPSAAEKRKRSRSNAQTRQWVRGQGEKRKSVLEGWLIMGNKSKNLGP